MDNPSPGYSHIEGISTFPGSLLQVRFQTDQMVGAGTCVTHDNLPSLLAHITVILQREHKYRAATQTGIHCIEVYNFTVEPTLKDHSIGHNKWSLKTSEVVFVDRFNGLKCIILFHQILVFEDR